MKVIRMKKENRDEFLRAVMEVGELWAPVQKKKRVYYDRIDDPKMIAKDLKRPILPLKKLIYPSKFSMFRFSEKGYEPTLDNIPTRIVFGVTPCDIHAILITDRVFMKDYPDPYYMKRRENTIIIGHSCEPDENCLCKSTNTHYVEEGFDLAMNDLGDFYLVWIGSSKGHDLTRLRPDLFDEDIKDRDIKKYLEWREKRDAQFEKVFDTTGLPDIMELSYNSPLWERLGEKCLSCGSCVMVCPTCNCFNVVDEISLAEKLEGERVRHWDACVFPEHALVAGGHNFRPTRAERIRLYYIHKLQAFVGEFGKPACVGCGRCVVTCPVDINVLEVVKDLKGKEAFV